ncbi:MAG TPA: ABC transporter substrate-binding protein [Candidatus Binatia bacterium]|jgi:ABC-type nitrate/sulfonate/bicarbonate transport system substrate-binding protein
MIRFTALFLCLSILFGPFAYSQSKPLKKIRVGVPSVTVGNIIIFVAKEAGLYEKYGLDAEIIVVQGSGVASKAMIGGSLDIAPVATPTVISANLAGADLTILAHTMPSVIHALMVKPEIKRAEDLKGKKIAISSFGSLTDFLVRSIMKKKGLSPDRDVSFLQIGGDAERLAALNQGVADAAAISYPGYARAQKLGFAMLWDSSKEINYPWMEIVTRRATIQRDRDVVLNYMKAHLEGIFLFKTDNRFGRRVIRRTLKLNDGELVNESYELFARSFLSIPYPNVPGMKTSFEYVAQTSPEIWNYKPEGFVDASFVEELDKRGFIKKLYQK